MLHLAPALGGYSCGLHITELWSSFPSREVKPQTDSTFDSTPLLGNIFATLTLRNTWQAIQLSRGAAPISWGLTFAAYAVPLSGTTLHYLTQEEELPEGTNKVLVWSRDFFCAIPGCSYAAEKLHTHLEKISLILSVAQGVFALWAQQYLFVASVVTGAALGLAAERYNLKVIHELDLALSIGSGVLLGDLLQKVAACFLLLGECKRVYDSFTPQLRYRALSIEDLTTLPHVPQHDPALALTEDKELFLPPGYEDMRHSLETHPTAQRLAHQSASSLFGKENFDLYSFLRSLSFGGVKNLLGQRGREVRVYRPHTLEDIAPQEISPLTEEEKKLLEEKIQNGEVKAFFDAAVQLGEPKTPLQRVLTFVLRELAAYAERGACDDLFDEDPLGEKQITPAEVEKRILPFYYDFVIHVSPSQQKQKLGLRPKVLIALREMRSEILERTTNVLDPSEIVQPHPAISRFAGELTRKKGGRGSEKWRTILAAGELFATLLGSSTTKLFAQEMGKKTNFSFGEATLWGQYSVKAVLDRFELHLLGANHFRVMEVLSFLQTWWEEKTGPDTKNMTVRELKERVGERAAHSLSAIFLDRNEEDLLNQQVQNVLLQWSEDMTHKGMREMHEKWSGRKVEISPEVHSFSLFVLSALGILEICPFNAET